MALNIFRKVRVTLRAGAAAALVVATLPLPGPAAAQQVAVVSGALESGQKEVALSFPAPGTYQIDLLPGVDVQSQVLELEIRRADGLPPKLVRSSDQTSTNDSRAWLVVEDGVQYSAFVSSWAAFYDAQDDPFLLVIQPSNREIVEPVALALGPRDGITRAVSYPQEEGRIFHLTPPRNGFLEITLVSQETSQVDPAISVFRGTDERGELLQSNDDAMGGYNSQIIQPVTAGQQLAIRVERYANGGSTGSATLGVRWLSETDVATASVPTDGAPVSVLFRSEGEAFVLNNALLRGSPFKLFKLDGAAAWPDPLVVTAAMMVSDSETGESYVGSTPTIEAGFDTPLGFMAFQSSADLPSTGAGATLPIDPAWANAAGEDVQFWKDRLRFRISVPAGTTGELRVTAGSSAAVAQATSQAPAE